MLIEKPKKQDLKKLIGRVIESKEREIAYLRSIEPEVENEWSNYQFAGLLTITNSWQLLQRNFLQIEEDANAARG